ncbi:MAG: hypothetical protein U1D26_03220 [Patescibacteria group bacterium]|nr:hypothetical protein [bacterium]MDZ4227464.1 hypothetical protein [Patescibacteria group bacterium]
MSINAEVTKSGNESPIATIRKFSRRVQGTGLVRSVRGSRYYSRDSSKIVKKKHALKMIKRRAKYQQLVKEGKVVERPRHGARRGPVRQESTPARLGESTPITR